MLNIQELQIQNNWWKNKKYKIPEINWPKRDLFYILKEDLKNSLILNTIGLRRTGKSSILKQLIIYLLNKKINPQNIFYFLFDNSSQIKTTEFLDDILKLYLTEVQQNTVSNLNEKIYIFLDEIQYIDNWQSVLKKYYDLSNKKIKFIITGSQSILLKEKARESLAGRIFDYYLPPLSFREFLLINKNKNFENFENFDLFDLPKIFFKLSNYKLDYGQKVFDLSKDYITYGQFPETNQLATDKNKQIYIMESILGKILEDCVKVYKIEKENEFKLIAYYLLNNISSIFEIKNIGQTIGLSKITLEKYVTYLKSANFFEILFKYHKSLIQRGRISKKIYTTSVNFNCALNYYQKKHITKTPQVFGKIIENLVFNILKQKYHNLNLSFYRQGNKEIDFVLVDNNNYLPIEVKFSDNISLGDLKTIIKYLYLKKQAYGIVVTKNKLDKRKIEDKIIYFIPYYLLLFL